MTNVTHVLKVTGTKLCQQFWPINTIPMSEKMLEIAVKEQLCEYCVKNAILVPNQSEFRKNILTPF